MKLIVLLLFVQLYSFSFAEVTLPHVLSNDAIFQSNFQYGARSFVWGSANPGEAVTVKEGRTDYKVNAGPDGKWKLQLNPSSAQKVEFTITGESGPAKTIQNVRFGDVYVCAGGADMAMPMSDIINATAEINTASKYTSKIQIFTTQKGWQPCTVENIREFSALCFLTIRSIIDEYYHTLPIGIVLETDVDADLKSWSPPSALDKCKVKGTSEAWQNQIYPLTNMSIRGVLFDPGFVDAGLSQTEYECVWKNMINTWRDVWQMGDYAWNFVQTSSTNTAMLQVMQSSAMPSYDIQTTGMAVSLDLNDPEAKTKGTTRYKSIQAQRLASATLHSAFAVQYPNVSSSPQPLSFEYDTSKQQIVITWEYGSDLILKSLSHCTSCCKTPSSLFQAFDAKENKWVNVSDVQISKIKSSLSFNGLEGSITKLSYNLVSNPECSVYNEQGFPASPFVVSINPGLNHLKPHIIEESKLLQSVYNRNGLKLDNNAAPTPPVGFNSWNFFHTNINERLLRATADAMVSRGMKAVGYRYVNIDDGWQVARHPSGQFDDVIVPDPVRFPSGMKSLADYIHKQGLKFGVYTARGDKTCQSRPGSRGHEKTDATTYVAWGVDYVKIDQCEDTGPPRTSWGAFRDTFKSLNASVCMSVESCGTVSGCGEWVADYANSWRIGRDIQNTWSSVISEIDLDSTLGSLAGPNHWNDPDMLVVGDVGLSYEEQKSHFSMWCMLAAPLLAGTNLMTMSDETTSLFTPPEVVAVNQDPLGIQGTTTPSANANVRIWQKRLKSGAVAVAMLNVGSSKESGTVFFDDIGFSNTTKANVRLLWERKDAGVFERYYSYKDIPPHGIEMVTLQPV